jgi:hypothetical protein
VIRKILIGLGILVLFIIILTFVSIKYNESLKPPGLVANFVDLNKVSRVSKFRSCTGHSTVPQDGREMKRNMKHYITLYPEYKKENSVEIFSPYDGYVALIMNEEIWVAPQRKSILNILPINQWMFSVIHVKPKEGLGIGSKVKAGELIGYGTFLQYPEFDPSFDAVYGTMGIPPKRIDNWNSPYGKLDSIFNHMSTEVLAEYEQKGLTRESTILSKEERDNNPCTYRDAGPYFENSGSNDWVELKK